MAMTLTSDEVVGGRYALIAPVREGGMGVVWRARDTVADKEVVVRELRFPPVFAEAQREALRARLVAEAGSASGLSDPALVPVIEVLEQDGRVMVVTELVERPTLAQVIAHRGPLRPARAAALGLEVLDVLEAAHARGLVHRFLQPSRLLMAEDGSVKVTDFGILALIGDPTVTTAGDVAGVPYYLAPEQALRGEVGPPADLWALMATLFFTVEGHPPFAADDPKAALEAITTQPFRPPIEAGALEPIFDAVLVKDPGNRPSLQEVRQQLTAVASPSGADTNGSLGADSIPRGRIGGFAPDTYRRPVSRPKRIFGGLLAILVMIVLVTLLVTNGRLGRGNEEEQAEPTVPSTVVTTTTIPRPAGVPPEWVLFDDRTTGLSVYYPPGWTVAPNAGALEIREPGTGVVARVGARTPPEPLTPDAYYQQAEAAFVAAHPDYARIQLTGVEFESQPAVIWEYLYTEGEITTRVVNFGIFGPRYTSDITFITRADDWERIKPVFYAVSAGFSSPDQ